MTRLTTDDIVSIADNLDAYDEELVAKTGCSLRAIACRAAAISESKIKKESANVRVGIISITLGHGVIKGFSQTVAGIVSHIGCEAFVSQAVDVAGVAEAIEKDADIIMFADDDRFVAIDLASRQVVDNAGATAKGFIAGLDLMACGLGKKNVLVIGCGAVGGCAVRDLIAKGARVSVYDITPASAQNLADAIQRTMNAEVRICKDLAAGLHDHKVIVEATPAANTIPARHIHPDTYISAPGVPLGLGEEAQSKIDHRVLHDPLQIGVATMITCALKFRI